MVNGRRNTKNSSGKRLTHQKKTPVDNPLKIVLTNALDVDPDYFDGKNGTRTILFDDDHLNRLLTAIRDHYESAEGFTSRDVYSLVSRAVEGSMTPERASDHIRLAYLQIIRGRSND
jgi:hypothetical protein